MEIMSTIRAVLFDMDGVLIDARDWHFQALNEALSPFGFDISYEEHLVRFNGLSTASKLNILSEERNFPRALHSLVNDVKQDRTLRLAGQFCFPIVQHQILISRLKSRKIAIGVVTNSIRKSAQALLTYAQLIDLIDVLVTNQDVSRQKPDPECYLLACKKLNFKPEEVLVIEDGEYGFEAATKAGCKVLRVESPTDVTLELISKEIPNLMEISS